MAPTEDESEGRGWSFPPVGWPDVVPESLRDQSDVRAARGELLGYFALLTGAVAPPFALFFWFTLNAPMLSGYVLAGGLVMVGTVQVLRWSGRLAVAANWASTALFATLGLLIPATGGLASPGLGWLPVIPIFSLVFAGRWYGVLWGGLVLAFLGLLYSFPSMFAPIEVSLEGHDRQQLAVFATACLTGLLALLFLFHRRFISELQAIGAEFEKQAEKDELTQLPNRRVYERDVRERLEEAMRGGEPVGIGLLDLDDFKAVNDEWGHDAGDELLRQVAQRLESVLRGSDLVARLGGDEFGLVLTGVATLDDLRTVADRVTSQFESPFELGETGGQVSVCCSVGLVIPSRSATHNESVEEQLERFRRAADRAMYRAKERTEDWAVRELD